jgi:broad specificity phosphatase PhoE
MQRLDCRHRVLVFTRWLLVGIMFFSANALHANAMTVWDALKSGNHFALMRHAIAPGTGDPAHFVIGECATQRNLSRDGKVQAKALGDAFRTNGINAAHVFSSQWCRCLETASLLALGSVEELLIANSFFRQYEREVPQTAMLKKWLQQQDLSTPTVLVTHQVNITALTGVYPNSGEMVVVKRTESDDLIVVGQFHLPL